MLDTIKEVWRYSIESDRPVESDDGVIVNEDERIIDCSSTEKVRC